MFIATSFIYQWQNIAFFLLSLEFKDLSVQLKTAGNNTRTFRGESLVFFSFSLTLKGLANFHELSNIMPIRSTLSLTDIHNFLTPYLSVVFSFNPLLRFYHKLQLVNLKLVDL